MHSIYGQKLCRVPKSYSLINQVKHNTEITTRYILKYFADAGVRCAIVELGNIPPGTLNEHSAQEWGLVDPTCRESYRDAQTHSSVNDCLGDWR